MKIILIVDSIINAALGILLLLFSPDLAQSFGVPPSSTAFYPNILGAVFIGVSIALLIGAFGGSRLRQHGLGFWGAVSINLCGGITLALWLVVGNLDLPVRGVVFLWLLVSLLILVSAVEAVLSLRQQKPT